MPAWTIVVMHEVQLLWLHQEIDGANPSVT